MLCRSQKATRLVFGSDMEFVDSNEPSAPTFASPSPALLEESNEHFLVELSIDDTQSVGNKVVWNLATIAAMNSSRIGPLSTISRQARSREGAVDRMPLLISKNEMSQERNYCLNRTLLLSSLGCEKADDRPSYPSKQLQSTIWRPFALILLVLCCQMTSKGTTVLALEPPIEQNVESPTPSPSMIPSLAPTVTGTTFPTFPTPTISPTVDPWEDVIVGKNFTIRILLPEDNAVSLAALATIWQNYLQNSLQSIYRNSEKVRLESVNIGVRNALTRLRRRLQQQSVATVNGQVNVIFERFSLDNSTMDFENQLDDALESLLAAENMEQALVNARIDDLEILSVEIQQDAIDNGAEDGDKDDGPNLVEMIVGFSLLGVAVLSLFFWLYIYCKIRANRKEERKRLDARKSQSTYVMPKQQRAPPPAPTNQNSEKAPAIARLHESTSDDQSSFQGMVDDSFDTSDPFARELSFAASMDEAAWQAQRRKNDQMRREGRTLTGLYPSMLRNHDEDEGFEMDVNGFGTMSGFPYGDDKSGKDPELIPAEASAISAISALSKGSSPLELSAEGAAAWATRSSPSNSHQLSKKVSFEPYGDGLLLNNRDSSPIGNHRGSALLRGDEPSSDAVRNSPRSSVTSIDSEPESVHDALALPLTPLGLNDSDGESEDGGSVTDMMKELAKLSAYVKSYSEKKDKEKEKKNEVQEATDSLRRKVGMNNGTRQSTGSRRELSSGYLAGLHSLNTTSDTRNHESLNTSSEISLSESEEETSLRLGIDRFNRQSNPQPPAPYRDHRGNVINSPESTSSRSSGRLYPSRSSLSSTKRTADETEVSPGSYYNSTSTGRNTVSPPDSPPSNSPQGSPGAMKPPGTVGPRRSVRDRVRLRNLRNNTTSMLDESREDAVEGVREEKKVEDSRPRTRGKPKAFDSLLSMYENKPKTTVQPSASNWQQSTSRKNYQ